MVNNIKKNLKKRTLRRIRKYKLKLLIIFLVILATVGIFTSFFVGTSSVLQSVKNFNENYNVEDGTFISDKKVSINDNIKYEKIIYGEVRQNGKTLRIFKTRKAINKHQVTKGTDIQNNNDILIDYNYLKANKLEIGRKIVLNNRSLSIVGTAISPDYITTKNSPFVLQANSKVFGIAFVNAQTFNDLFGDSYSSYYSYKSNLNLHKVSKDLKPLSINNSENNTRIQQVIGDAEAPKNLAVLLTCLLFLIVAVLLSVYHFEVSKKEKNNLNTFKKLGFSKITLFKHYATETNLAIFLAWLVGGSVGALSIKTIMQMNSQIYNYPILEENFSILILCLILSLVLLFVINSILVYQFYVKANTSNRIKVKKGKKINNNRSKILPFSYWYRLKRASRNKKESVLFMILIFFVGLLINFSFLLKDSVTQYVDDLAEENTFKEILFLSPLNQENIEGEKFKLYNLYDEDDVTQSVYVIGSDSKYYKYNLNLKEGDVVISKAFSQKYKKGIGDTLKLYDVTNQKRYSFKINKINSVTTVSNIYIVSNNRNVIDERTYFTSAVALGNSYKKPNDNNLEAKLTRNEIITSGKNILAVINKQITLILSLALILQVALLYSLLEFSFQNSIKSIKILKLEGYSLKQLMKMHFAFSFPLAVFCVVGSYLISRIIVRLFLDKIMFNFVNFVNVTNNLTLVFISNGMVISIFTFFLLRIRLKIKSL
ncbi:FtsX-like permease family protein [Priestia megaterium]|uniref:FtsX-like permease family protein n=1 Tax=Priestia megaterium TaxID=1404 RepID=UPI00203F60CF|nr:FtsX-like permease family protein [Priestia megaterium]MCM3546821.1 ABC transporter permease [Priestia megaterium]